MGAACRTAEVTALDVVYALKRQGKTIYGFGDAARGTGHATLERRIAASPGVCVGYVGFFFALVRHVSGAVLQDLLASEPPSGSSDPLEQGGAWLRASRGG